MKSLFSLLKALGGDFARLLTWRVPVLAVSLVLSDLLEGIGLALLLPVLGRFASGQGQGLQTGTLARWISSGLAAVGLGQSLISLLAVIVVAVICQHAMYILASWLLAYCKGRYMTAWRERLFSRVMSARWHFFTERKMGQLANTILDETRYLSQLIHEAALVFDGLVLVTIYLILTFASAWQVALVIVAFGGIMFLLTSPILRNGLRTGVKARAEADSLHTVVIEFLAGAKLIKSTASEARAEQTFQKFARRYAPLFVATTFHSNVIRSVYELVAILLLAVCLWAGISRFNLDFGSIALSIYLFLRIYQRLSQIQQSAQVFQGHRAAFDTVLTLYDQAGREAEPLITPASEAPSMSAGAAAIRLSQVSVSYDGKPALNDASLDLPAGAVIGIAGPSGAGKSTLVDCILGLAAVDKGSVEIDGHNLDTLSLGAWRRSVGYVAQETFLFNASVAENIRWGNALASDQEVERAARRAHADTFVRAMPLGFQTEVGDRGVRLSGGQRQRLGLARALVGNPRLLVLDEATSALDSESEKAVLEAIGDLRGQMTVIMVAHRLSTLRDADVLCLIENGRVVEIGPWDQLIRPGTRFNDFWKLQSDERSALQQG